MSTLLLRVVRTALAALIFASLVAVQTGAAPRPRTRTEKQITADIAAARADYERVMAEVRKSMSSVFDKRERAARNLKEPNLSAINDLNRQREALVESGKWPEALEKDADLEMVRGKAGDAWRDLEGALEEAKRECEISGAADRALEIAQMIDDFGSQGDLNEWGENWIKDGAERLVKGGTLNVTIPFQDRFRLDMQAKQIGDRGSLVIELTLHDGSTMRLDPAPRDKGIVRAMVSVREGRVTVDYGARVMTTDAVAPQPGSGSTITLRAVGGDFKSLSVRAKRIVQGKPESLSARKILAERAKAKADAARARQEAARPNLGGQWRGFVHFPGGAANVAVNVGQANENWVMINVDWAGIGGHELIFRFRPDGGHFLDHLRANGNRGEVFLKWRGSFFVSGNTMVINYSAFAPGKGWKNFKVVVHRI